MQWDPPYPVPSLPPLSERSVRAFGDRVAVCSDDEAGIGVITTAGAVADDELNRSGGKYVIAARGGVTATGGKARRRRPRRR